MLYRDHPSPQAWPAVRSPGVPKQHSPNAPRKAMGWRCGVLYPRLAPSTLGRLSLSAPKAKSQAL